MREKLLSKYVTIFVLILFTIDTTMSFYMYSSILSSIETFEHIATTKQVYSPEYIEQTPIEFVDFMSGTRLVDITSFDIVESEPTPKPTSTPKPTKAPEVMKINIAQTRSNTQFTNDEIKLMERCVMSEAGGYDYKMQKAVAETILNRLRDSDFPNSIRGVITQKYQYSTHNNGVPTDSVKKAVADAISNPSHPCDMFFFRTGYYHKWAKDYKRIGVMYFSTRK